MSRTLYQQLFQSLSPLQRSVISAVAGFFFYGSWALLVNWKHGMMAALKAASVQGSYSFILTLVMTILLEGVFRLNSKVFNRTRIVNWSTIVMCCAAIFSASWMLNTIAGTPEVWRTVILGYVIGGIYSIAYVHGLARDD